MAGNGIGLAFSPLGLTRRGRLAPASLFRGDLCLRVEPRLVEDHAFTVATPTGPALVEPESTGAAAAPAADFDLAEGLAVGRLENLTSMARPVGEIPGLGGERRIVGLCLGRHVPAISCTDA